MMRKITLCAILLVLMFAISAYRYADFSSASVKPVKVDTIQFPGETHFANVRQLTFGGDNAEAYLSFDGKYLVFQKTNPKEGIA